MNIEKLKKILTSKEGWTASPHGTYGCTLFTNEVNIGDTRVRVHVVQNVTSCYIYIRNLYYGVKDWIGYECDKELGNILLDKVEEERIKELEYREKQREAFAENLTYQVDKHDFDAPELPF